MTRVGYSGIFGGVGAELTIGDSATNFNVLEARGGAGGGWQFSSIMYSYDSNNVLTNQATGNSKGYQWGYSSNISSGGGYLTSSNWSPYYSDSFNGLATTPCQPFDPNQNNVQYFDNGSQDVSSQLKTTSAGNAVQVDVSVKLKSLANQYWSVWQPVHALYLSRAIGRQRNMKLYLIPQNNPAAPVQITPYNDFSGIM